MTRRTRLPQMTDRIPLGAGGLQVSPICLGIVEDPDAIPAAFDLGVNFFFVTADMHWPYYEAIREGLKRLIARGSHVRDQIVVAGVSYVSQPEFTSEPFREIVMACPFLERLDVLVAGGVYGWELERRWPQYERNGRQRFVGARAIGASFHDRKAARAAIADARVDVAFVRYNPAHPGARIDVFPYVGDRKAPVFIFKSTTGYIEPERAKELGVGEDFWQPRIQDHYRFVLTQPAVDGILCAPRTVAEVKVLGETLAQGPLTDDEEDHLIELSSLDEATRKSAAKSSG